jgi:hypothetical protein
MNLSYFKFDYYFLLLIISITILLGSVYLSKLRTNLSGEMYQHLSQPTVTNINPIMKGDNYSYPYYYKQEYKTPRFAPESVIKFKKEYTYPK